MLGTPNALRWSGAPGHYEVYYVTLTDPVTGVGVWIRYAMSAPIIGDAEGSLWFLAMDPRKHARGTFAVKSSVPISELNSEADPFSLRIGPATLSDGGMSGGVGDARWSLRWAPGRAYEHVHPL